MAPQIVKRPGRCQCLSTCKLPSLEDSAFCEKHQEKCERISPMTGWEPQYFPKFWNLRAVRLTHNCMAYALQIIDMKQIMKCFKDTNCDEPFHQPGLAAGYSGFKSDSPKTCPEITARMLGDNPSIRPITFEEKCPPMTSKIFLVVDEDEDYHFGLQNKDGWWSQKGGAKPVTNLDAGGHPVWDPSLADNNWTNAQGPLNYDVFCGFFCVPRREKWGDEIKIHVKVGGKRTTKKKIHRRRRVALRGKKAKKFHISQTKRYRDRKV